MDRNNEPLLKLSWKLGGWHRSTPSFRTLKYCIGRINCAEQACGGTASNLGRGVRLRFGGKDFRGYQLAEASAIDQNLYPTHVSNTDT